MTRPTDQALSELPDSIRVPLDEVWADVDYLMARVLDDPNFRNAAVQSIRSRIDEAKKAIRHHGAEVAALEADARRELPKSLDEELNCATMNLEMIATGKDPVTGTNLTYREARKIAGDTHKALLTAWNKASAKKLYTMCSSCKSVEGGHTLACQSLGFETTQIPIPEDSPWLIRQRLRDRVERTAQPSAAPKAEGDWYTDEHTGSHVVDIDQGANRQLALLLKKDGTVSFAAYVDGERTTGDAMGDEFVTAVRAWSAPQPARASDGGGDRSPDGYAYRYPPECKGGRSFIRHNNGGEVNGARPIETIPYYYARPPLAAAAQVAGDAERFRKLYAQWNCLSTGASNRILDDFGLGGEAHWTFDKILDHSSINDDSEARG